MSTGEHGAEHRSFGALRHKDVATLIVAAASTMMADNVEHVISYWVAFQHFHSPTLGGLAVIAHWLPYIFFAVRISSLAERYDPRRFMFIATLIYMAVSLSWAALIASGTLQLWQAGVLLTLHGIASAFWGSAAMLQLYRLVPGRDLQSAARLNATGRTLGLLVGPAVGSMLMLTLGPAWGIASNVVFYLPLFLWAAPWRQGYVTRPLTAAASAGGLAEMIAALKSVRALPVVFAMTLTVAGASLLVGNSYQAQMPAFANDLGHGNPGVTYAMLLGADAAGAVVAGIVLDGLGLLRPHPATVLVLAMLWCGALAGFSQSTSFTLSVALLFSAGFVELAFSSMAQSLVQLNAPTAIRGPVIGVFLMAFFGLRIGSGVSVGLFGTLIGVHSSLFLCAVALALFFAAVLGAGLRNGFHGHPRVAPP